MILLYEQGFVHEKQIITGTSQNQDSISVGLELRYNSHTAPHLLFRGRCIVPVKLNDWAWPDTDTVPCSCLALLAWQWLVVCWDFLSRKDLRLLQVSSSVFNRLRCWIAFDSALSIVVRSRYELSSFPLRRC